MKLSELIAKHGDDTVEYQALDQCVTNFQSTKQGTRASFNTPQRFSIDGFTKMGLLVWLDRDKVKELMAKEKGNDPGT